MGRADSENILGITIAAKAVINLVVLRVVYTPDLHSNAPRAYVIASPLNNQSTFNHFRFRSIEVT